MTLGFTPKIMRALICDEHGELSLGERPVPTLPPMSDPPQALVQIEAFGINRADLLQRAGHYPPPPGVSPEILGLEFTGVIIATNLSSADLTVDLQVGTRVMGICAGGAYAEYIVTPLEQLLPVPPHFSVEEAGGFAEAQLTAFDALAIRGALKSGDRVLIHAIGSGVGSAAAHLAAFMGAEVIGTTRSAWKRERALKELPVQDVWLTDQGFSKPRDEPSFDVIIDFVGAAYLEENLKSLAIEGRLVVVGLLGGIRAEIHLGLLLARRAQVIGTVLRSRSVEEKIELTRRFCREILPAFYSSSEGKSSSRLQLAPPQITESDHPSQVDRLHQRLADGDVWSKLTCVWSRDEHQ